MTKLYSVVGGIAVIAVSLVYLLTVIGVDDSFYPRLEDSAGKWLGGDEVIYYLNAKGFAENPALHDCFTYTGIGSSLSNSGPYGPGYTVFRGGIMYLFDSPISFVWTNVILLLICVLLLQFYGSEQKIQKQLIILCYPFTWLFTFSLMQETISIFFAVVLSLLAGKVLTSFKKREYMALLLVFSITVFFRPPWALASFILLLISSKRKTILLNGLIVFALFVEAYWVQSNLAEEYSSGSAAPAFNQIIGEISKGDVRGALVIAFYSLKQNIQDYVEQATFSLGALYSVLETMPIVMLSVFFLEVLYDQKKKAFASVIVLASIVVVTFVLYDVCCWREIRLWGGPAYMALLLCSGRQVGRLRNLVSVLSVFGFVFHGVQYQSEQIATRQISDMEMQQVEKRADCFLPLTKVESVKKPVIFIGPEFFNQINLMALPLTLEKGGSIRYVLPLYHTTRKNYNLILRKDENCENSEYPLIEAECFFLCSGKGHHWEAN